MERKEVCCPHLKTIGYDLFSRTLEVEYFGEVIQYFNVSPGVYRMLSETRDVELFFVNYIEDIYPHHAV